jgi:hypothetical protein
LGLPQSASTVICWREPRGAYAPIVISLDEHVPSERQLAHLRCPAEPAGRVLETSGSQAWLQQSDFLICVNQFEAIR